MRVLGRKQMIDFLFVGLGGFFGSVCRYMVSLIPLGDERGFPYKTMIINVIGAFVLGLISAWISKNPTISQRLVLMLKVGVCGGFTTFSTFAFESSSLISNGKFLLATTYILISIFLGVLATVLGLKLIG